MSPAVTRLNPERLHQTPGYHHVTIVESDGMAFLAGQCPLDNSGRVVGLDDVAAQVDQVAANALTMLAAVGAQPRHVARSVIYGVSDDNAVLSAVWRRFTESVIGPTFTSASILLGVAGLGFTGQLVEVDLTVALPD